MRINLNKQSFKIIVASSCLATILGVGYTKAKSENHLYSYSLYDDIHKSRLKKADRLINQYKELYGIPAVIVSVSKNGKKVYEKAVGYSDVENNVRANVNTVMRIASISKPLACLIAAKLHENGKLDLDKSIHEYLSDLPRFKIKDNEYKITSRQLMCHTSGIRHYKQDEKNNSDNKDTNFQEFYLNKYFSSSQEALGIFINDDLLFEPGTKYFYTTFGYTLLSAVLEKISAVPFSKLVEELLKKIELNDTYLDKNEPIIPNRSKYYMRNDKGKLVNVPFVDNSYKWAGGGLLSNVNDLIKFGNLMLKMYQTDNKVEKFLSESTIKSELWKPQSFPNSEKKNLLGRSNEVASYGLGWCLVTNEIDKLKFVYHTGGAVGASSCLLIIPEADSSEFSPKGTVVAVLCNSQNVNEIVNFSKNIARIFSDRI